MPLFEPAISRFETRPPVLFPPPFADACTETPDARISPENSEMWSRWTDAFELPWPPEVDAETLAPCTDPLSSPDALT